MTSAEVRQQFLDYFASKGHQAVSSSSLVPANDPTLLFTNAGMVQFKDVFVGSEKRPYVRAVSSQRCVRAGGKHNDLENVGYTARHHTFFEMLGNFSFGDYFKREAIHYAWEFLTQVMGLPEEKLWVTVFEEDDEAADIWLKDIGISADRLGRIGAKDNFWSMGDTGPCGPCSEIFYDHGADIPGGPPGSPDEDGDRYIEIWNLVFMQYDRDSDGKLNPLPQPSVDTGMGLERLAAVMQGKHNNYDIDLFQSLIIAAAKITGEKDQENKSLRVIADHIRSCAFLILDGVLPANEGRGYVLRRIIRRAARHGNQLGMKNPFFYKLVAALNKEMGEAYPELTKQQKHIEKILKLEEERFAETLEKGMRLLEADIENLKGKVIAGDTVFVLYDTYGFPADLTADVAREKGLTIDQKGFEKCMDEQKNRARAASKFSVDEESLADVNETTVFVGYDSITASSKVVVLLKDGQPVDVLHASEQGVVVTAETPFYAESGGQVGDTGLLTLSSTTQFEVFDTRKQGNAFLHFGMMKNGSIKIADRLDCTVDKNRRQAIVLNHSATHLMHAALRQVLGDHVQQKGSLVDPDRLRFDFSHFEPLTQEQIQQVEDRVNQQIRNNATAEAKVMAQDEALESGAMALFGEKYGDEVRVLSIGDFSVELCGGVHVKRAGDIGLFKIIAETGVASGVRRVEAITGEAALQLFTESENHLDEMASLLKTKKENVSDRLQQLVEKNRLLEKELEQLKGKLASQAGSDLADEAVDVDGIQVLAIKLDGADNKTLRDTMDQLKNKLGKAAIVLASVSGEKITLVAGVTKDETKRVKAGDLVNAVATQVGGKGGGRPDMAQAGGNNPAALDAALSSVVDWVREAL